VPQRSTSSSIRASGWPTRSSFFTTILVVIGLYGLALLCDVRDHPIFTLTDGLVSGYTAKHPGAADAAAVPATPMDPAATRGRVMLKG
jgi:hypothetical protein